MGDTTTRDELRPCPFCGGEAMMLKDHKRLGVYIGCTVCHVCGLTGLPLEAVRHWNTRASRQEVSVSDLHVFILKHGDEWKDEGAVARALLAKYSITIRTE